MDAKKLCASIGRIQKECCGTGENGRVTVFIETKNMLKAVLPRLLPALLLTLSVPGFAQEGHPYVGTWRGSIDKGGETAAVVVIMDYDGENITGMINPGRSSYRFQNAMHDAPSWHLHVTAQTRDGEAVEFAGVMHEIGAVNRYIEGTWTQAGQTWPLRITRE
jgi:hypothetical protein